jgi:hypothetical protein
MVTNKEFPARESILPQKTLWYGNFKQNFSETILHFWHWKENLERRLSAIYKQDYVLQYQSMISLQQAQTTI